MPSLIDQNRAIVDALTDVAEQQRREKYGYLKVLFTLIHREITKEVIRAVNLRLFDKPESLLDLNRLFATKYLRAARGESVSPGWKEAFGRCEKEAKDLEDLSQIRANAAKWGGNGPSETDSDITEQGLAQKACSEAEGKVHINQDIAEALAGVQCNVTPRDFGNMLELVHRGTRSGIKEADGKLIGWFEVKVKELILPSVEETWRNATFKLVCGVDVPKPEESFVKKVNDPTVGGW